MIKNHKIIFIIYKMSHQLKNERIYVQMIMNLVALDFVSICPSFTSPVLCFFLLSQSGKYTF